LQGPKRSGAMLAWWGRGAAIAGDGAEGAVTGRGEGGCPCRGVGREGSEATRYFSGRVHSEARGNLIKHVSDLARVPGPRGGLRRSSDARIVCITPRFCTPLRNGRGEPTLGSSQAVSPRLVGSPSSKARWPVPSSRTSPSLAACWQRLLLERRVDSPLLLQIRHLAPLGISLPSASRSPLAGSWELGTRRELKGWEGARGR